ncbi:hypothetical protein P4204_00010 [Pseudomonas aeruginosa]|nr:hypothetical protein [Pseudomonas aeruginosa]
MLPDLEQILVVLGQHSDLIPHLMAVAADVDEEWVKGLRTGMETSCCTSGGW